MVALSKQLRIKKLTVLIVKNNDKQTHCLYLYTDFSQKKIIITKHRLQQIKLACLICKMYTGIHKKYNKESYYKNRSVLKFIELVQPKVVIVRNYLCEYV